MNKSKLLILVNVDWFFLSHRLPIALYAQKCGYDVTIACDDTGRRAEIEGYGLKFIPSNIKRAETGIMSNLKALWSIYRLYKNVQPDIIHNVTIKPVLYGSFIARLLRKKNLVNAISGMGYLFTNNRDSSLLLRIYKSFTRYSFNGKGFKFIVQNKTDYNGLIQLSKVAEENILLIKGSGIDLEDFAQAPEPAEKPIKILLHARMLWDKGVKEFVEMANVLKSKYGNDVECILCGDTDENKTSIPIDTLQEWNKSGCVQWIGHRKDVKTLIEQVHIVVFPSYREGFPKSLIEASAIGRPIITADAVGSRDAVVHDKNGFIVPIKNIDQLIKYATILIEDKDLRIKMGAASRQMAEEFYDINNVCQQTINLYEK